MSEHFDVVICGGGLAGLTLARQLRQELDVSVCVVEKTVRPLPAAAHKVGESSVELGSQYFERLGLRDYLHENHLIKFGLRFFPGGGHLPLEERLELGPFREPIVTSYQLDRGRFENDLRAMLEGATLLEGWTARDVVLSEDDAPHRLTVEQGDDRRELTARWLVDATGRAAFLKRRMKLRRGSRHKASAGWFRVDGKLDVNDLAPATATGWHGAPSADQRWRSTNHFMGDGYWVWVIPLPGDKTSIGVVVHEDTHSFDDVRTLERARAFIDTHEPLVANLIEGREVLDFLCLKDYSYGVVRSWSPQRWALVGEAGAFPDPLYSPGSDFIAFANSFTGELIRVDVHGDGDLEARTRDLNLQYRALVIGCIEVFRRSSPVYGHPRAMAAKIYWDNFAYWSFPCQYYLQDLYRISGPLHSEIASVGARFVELSGYVQELMRAWAERAPEAPVGAQHGLPAFPSLVVDAHLKLTETMTPEETRDFILAQAEIGEQLVCELVFRLARELGPSGTEAVFDALRVSRWNLRMTPGRMEPEALRGRTRRRALPVAALDLERSLGPVRLHPDADEAGHLVVERLSRAPAPSRAWAPTAE